MAQGLLVNNNRQYQKAPESRPHDYRQSPRTAQQIETSVTTLAAETDAARRSDVFRGWLNAMAQFHNYSWNNQLLIAMQCPTATRVAGFNTWRKMNRFVRKGEKGIAIFAPCIYKPKKQDEPEGTDEHQTRTAEHCADSKLPTCSTFQPQMESLFLLCLGR